MIRIIPVGDKFAIYDTVTDTFFADDAGDQTWHIPHDIESSDTVLVDRVKALWESDTDDLSGY